MKHHLSFVNVLSIWRFVLVPYFFYSYITGERVTALTLAGLILFSDFLDGYLAKRLKKVTPLGGTLDAIADKLFISLGLLAFLLTGGLTIIQALLAFSKDIILVLAILFMGSRKKLTSFKSAGFGKAVAVLQYSMIISIMLDYSLNWYFIAGILILLPFALNQYYQIYLRN